MNEGGFESAHRQGGRIGGCRPKLSSRLESSRWFREEEERLLITPRLFDTGIILCVSASCKPSITFNATGDIKEAVYKRVTGRAHRTDETRPSPVSMVLEMEQSARRASRTEPRLQASAWVVRRFQSWLKKPRVPGVHVKSAVKLPDFKSACSQVATDKSITKYALWPFKP